MATPTETFDYVILGGGTSGLVLASRLSESPSTRVLVIEAGPDNSSSPAVLGPAAMAGQYGRDEYDWNFASSPQSSLHPPNRRINQPRGRQLGGSSCLNFLLVAYPSRADLDGWESLGNKGWSFDTLAPYFRKSHTVHAPPLSALAAVPQMGEHGQIDPLLRGKDGPVQVSFGDGYAANMHGAWMETWEKLGVGIAEMSGVKGAYQNPATIDPRTKTRSTAATAYYGEEVRRRANLVVWTESVVEKILFDDEKGEELVATGVHVRCKDGETKTVLASAEVILAAGSLHTPQILELSGVGNPEVLSKHGIPVLLDNPKVGENLQDHPMIARSFEVQDGIPTTDLLRDPAIAQALVDLYTSTGGGGPMGQSVVTLAFSPLVDGDGILSTSARESLLDAHFAPCNKPSGGISEKCLAHTRSLIEDPLTSALEFYLFPGQVTISHEPSSMLDLLLPSQPENHLSILANLNYPLSRGSVHIASADVADKPVWDPNYLSHPLDLELLARATQFAERLVATEPLAGIFKQNGKRIPDLRARSDLEVAREVVRQRHLTIYHPCGSCSMLPKEDGGVVDENLRVYGTKNLRVVDASIVPMEPMANLQMLVYAVAERAADLIKQDRETATMGT